MAEQGGNVILGTVLVKGHHAGQPRGPHMDFHPHMPKAPQGWRHLGDDVVPVFDPQGFKYPFVVRFPESAVSHPRAAEVQDFIIQTGIVVFEVDGAEYGQGRAVRMAGHPYMPDVGRDCTVNPVSYRRPLIGI